MYKNRLYAQAAGEPAPSVERFQAFARAREQLSDLVADYLRIQGLADDAAKIHERANIGGLRASEKWESVPHETPDEVHAFYRDLTEYFPELIRWNTSPSFQRILAGLERVRGERVLEIGGGLGTTAEYLATRGNRVDYYDLPGVLLDFARWRFSRLDGEIPAGGGGEIVNEWGSVAYDRVVAIDVIEHFHPDEFERLTDSLARALRPGGVLFAHNHFDKRDGIFPFHYEHADEW